MTSNFILSALNHLREEEPLAIDLLSRAANNDRLSHAYLFTGKDFEKSMTIIRAFSKILLCDNKNATDNCLSCRVFDSGQNPDFRIWKPEIEKTKFIKLEQIQELISESRKYPITSKSKVLVLEEVNQMRVEGSNSLLKTLEEPSPFTTIILTVDSLDNLLSTIISRCQIIPIRSTVEKNTEEINLKDYFPNSYIQASEMSTKMSKVEKEEISKFLKNLENTLWQVSKYNIISETNFNNRIEFLEKIEKYIVSLESYVNLKILLENLFIDLYKYRKVFGF